MTSSLSTEIAGDPIIYTLGPVIQSLVLPVFYPFEYLFLRSSIACQLVGDDHPWRKALGLEQFSEELLGGCFVATTLHQDI